MSDCTLPQVGLPQGRVSLAVDPAQLVPFLNRLLQEVIDGSTAGSSTPLPAAPLPMPTAAPTPAPRPISSRPRVRGDGHPDHHLWNNNGVWFVVYTIYPTPVTKERLRHSLGTRCLETARLRRDAILERYRAQGILALSRQPAPAP
jgi:hypothetical protein